jgi:hypothetical protein
MPISRHWIGGSVVAAIFACSPSNAFATPSWPDVGTLICEQQHPSRLTSRMRYSLLDHSGSYEIIAAHPLSAVPEWAKQGSVSFFIRQVEHSLVFVTPPDPKSGRPLLWDVVRPSGTIYEPPAHIRVGLIGQTLPAVTLHCRQATQAETDIAPPNWAAELCKERFGEAACEGEPKP